MTELQVKTKKGSLKKFFAMFLAVCVCLTTIQVNAAFTETTDGETTVSVSKKTMELDVAGKKTDEITITSNKKQTVTEWKVSPDNANADVIEGPNGKPMVTPEGAGEAVVSSSNTQTVPVKVDVTVTGDKDAITYKVDGAKITVEAKKAGKATITVTTKDGGFKKTCNVTVKIPVKSVSLDKTKLTLGAKEKFTLKATVKPSNATNKTVTWKTSNKKVATVSKGKVTTKKAGKVTITAKADGKSKKCVITVKKAPNKITLNAKKKTLKKGKKFQIKAKLPKNTASYKITYKSSNKKVATVSASGKVTAKKKGKAIITVTTFNKKKATLKITVK